MGKSSLAMFHIVHIDGAFASVANLAGEAPMLVGPITEEVLSDTMLAAADAIVCDESTLVGEALDDYTVPSLEADTVVRRVKKLTATDGITATVAVYVVAEHEYFTDVTPADVEPKPAVPFLLM